MTFVESYRPKKFEEIKGQPEAVSKVKDFISNFSQRKNAILLHGPPGSGKTTIAHVVAREYNSEIFELNASDLRNRNNLKEVLKPALEQDSLTNRNKIILVDEIDGISKADWGGLPELLNLISVTRWPVILTANDVWDKRLNSLRKKVEMVQLKEINYNVIKDVLISVLKKENKFVNHDILTGISIKAKGDLRAALNDLQTALQIKDPSQLLGSERNKETDIFNALRVVFKQKPNNEVLRIFDSVSMPIDDIILWVEENIPNEYKGEELVRAFELLSKVDLFKGRIYRKQYWRFLVYENIFLSYGISSSKKDIKRGFTSYKRPSRILKIWINNQKNAKKKSIAKKYAHYVHVGEKRALKEFPLIKQILKNQSIKQELRLEKEEIEYLEKTS